ncbi:MAG: flagellar motor switch protein FliG [Planctomycetota bacterium]|nr:flagellar motor switch protein FliG [Planctomycetota bacterium]
MPDQKRELKGRRRAAAFMLSLDSETAALLMTRFNEREVALLSEEMTRLGELSGSETEELLRDFNKRIGGDKINVEPMIQEILERALGKEKARELLERIRRQSRESEPFRALLPLDASQITTLLRGEHPQVIALVVSHLEPAVAAALLKDMPEDLRYDVIKRIASTAELPAELVRQIDEMMEVRAYSLGRSLTEDQGNRRYKTVAQMLNLSEPSLSKTILDRLNRENPQLANEIQSLMFVFDDLAKVPDRDMQKILSQIDKGDLILALRAAEPAVKDKLLNNLSTRAREALLEELESMGPRPLHEIEEAQKRILQQVRAMEEKGEIRISRGQQEKMV